MINAVVLLATGVNGDGHREVLGMRVATAETGPAWNSFFADLVARGLGGVRLVTSDDRLTLLSARDSSILPRTSRPTSRSTTQTRRSTAMSTPILCMIWPMF